MNNRKSQKRFGPKKFYNTRIEPEPNWNWRKKTDIAADIAQMAHELREATRVEPTMMYVSHSFVVAWARRFAGGYPECFSEYPVNYENIMSNVVRDSCMPGIVLKL